MGADVQPEGAGTQDAGAGPARNIQSALARLTDRLDDLVRRLPHLVPDPGGLPGTPLDEADRRELAGLRAVLAVDPTMPTEHALRLLLDRAVHQCDADVAAVLVPGVDGALTLAAALGLRGADGAIRLEGGGLAERALREGEVIRGDEAAVDRDPLLRASGLSAAVALPAPGGDRPARAILLVGRRRSTPFSPASLQTLLLLADRLGTVLAAPGGSPAMSLGAPVSQLVERPAEQLAEQPAGRWLSADLDLDRVAQELVRVAAERLGGASVALILPEPAGFVVAARFRSSEQAEVTARVDAPDNGRPAGGEGPSAPAVLEARLLGMVAESRRPWLAGDGESGRELEDLLGSRPRLVVPLVASERLVGLLVAGAERPLSSERLDPLLPEAAVVVRNARLYRDAVLGLAEARAARAPVATLPPPARDFANLLAVVLGRLAALRDRVADTDGQRDVDVAEEAAWRAAEAMRGLLGFAPGRRGTPLAPLDLGTVVREAVTATSARRAAGGRPPPALRLDLEVVPPVRGSAEDLGEMLDHLLDNALESGSADGPPTVRVRWDGGTHVDLSVEDSGPGMDEIVRARALEPFFSTKGAGHLGLGLPVAQAIVARHHGELAVESEPGLGTTVRVRLLTVASARRPTGASTAVARILLVEDEAPVREALLGALCQQGHVVHVAADGRAALAILERESVDAIVTDLALPGLSGLEVARLAKRLHPGIPVILITAWPAGPDASRLEASGVDAVVDKPVGLSEFRATVAMVLARRGVRAP